MAITQEEILKLFKDGRLDVNHVFDVEPSCIEIVEDEKNISIATFGGFTTVVAPQKAGKTTFLAIIVAAYLFLKTIANFKANVPEGKEAVLWIDTEQSPDEAIETMKKVCMYGGISTNENPVNLYYWPLREYGHADLNLIIDQFVNLIPNLGLLIIDGERDLLANPNDLNETYEAVQNLKKWTMSKNIHCLNIIHQNKGDDNLRGHLGKELENKAQTVIRIKKDGDGEFRKTIVECKDYRKSYFKPFAIQLINGVPSVVGVSLQTFNPKDPAPDQLTSNQIVAILEKTYETKPVFTRGELDKEIYRVCNEIHDSNGDKMFKQFGMNKVTGLIVRMKDENYLQIRDKHYYKNIPGKTINALSL